MPNLFTEAEIDTLLDGLELPLPTPLAIGPECPCCGERNMERMGYSMYHCRQSWKKYLLIVDGEATKGYRMVPTSKERT